MTPQCPPFFPSSSRSRALSLDQQHPPTILGLKRQRSILCAHGCEEDGPAFPCSTRQGRLFSHFAVSFFLCMFLVGQLSAQGRWIEVPLPAQDTTLFRISFVDSLNGWIAGRSGVLLATTDGGNTWRKDSVAATLPIFEFKFVSPTVGWLLVSIPGPPGLQHQLYRSTDSGIAWTEKPLPDSLYITAISFTSEDLVRVAGNQELWATTNGTQTWELRSTPPSGWCGPASLDFYDELSGYAGGSWVFPSPCFLETTDGGFSWIDRWQWEPQGSISLRILDGRLGLFWLLYFIEEPPPQKWVDELWLTSNRGTSFRYFPNVPFSLGGSQLGWATDSLNFWLLRRNGRIARTTNGGTNWQDDTLAVPITELLCNTYGTRLALGSGRLFRFDVGTDVVDGRDHPVQFSLFQNYPNPFNPQTTIKYKMPKSSLVSLKVFDVLGRELERLVEEFQEPGTHEVTWDASGCASGVYFYCLRVGSVFLVRKMMVLR